MPDDTTACPRCEGLLVMVAVRCSHCGEFHRSGDGSAHRAGAAPSSWRDRGPVFDVPAVLADTPTRTEPASAVVPAPVRPDLLRRSAPPRMRTSATYANGTRPSHPTPKALSPGRPAASPPSPPPASPDPPRHGRTEPRPPRRPLVQIVREVLNRSVTHDPRPGTRVVVRNRFNGRWTPGFAVHEVLDAGYRIRRDHTGAVLPGTFVRSDVAADKSTRGVGAKLPDRAAARVSL